MDIENSNGELHVYSRGYESRTKLFLAGGRYNCEKNYWVFGSDRRDELDELMRSVYTEDSYKEKLLRSKRSKMGKKIKYHTEENISKTLEGARRLWKRLIMEDSLDVGGFGTNNCYIKCFYVANNAESADWHDVIVFENAELKPYAEEVVKWLQNRKRNVKTKLYMDQE